MINIIVVNVSVIATVIIISVNALSMVIGNVNPSVTVRVDVNLIVDVDVHVIVTGNVKVNFFEVSRFVLGHLKKDMMMI